MLLESPASWPKYTTTLLARVAVLKIAGRVIGAIVDRFLLLSKHPQLGRRRDDDLRTGLRSIAVGEYVILYRLDGKDVVILHVLHGRRDIPSVVSR